MAAFFYCCDYKIGVVLFLKEKLKECCFDLKTFYKVNVYLTSPYCLQKKIYIYLQKDGNFINTLTPN